MAGGVGVEIGDGGVGKEDAALAGGAREEVQGCGCYWSGSLGGGKVGDCEKEEDEGGEGWRVHVGAGAVHRE